MAAIRLLRQIAATGSAVTIGEAAPTVLHRPAAAGAATSSGTADALVFVMILPRVPARVTLDPIPDAVVELAATLTAGVRLARLPGSTVALDPIPAARVRMAPLPPLEVS